VTIYHVFANRSNVGDWLSARGIQSLLAPRPVTELLCDEPFIPETLARLSTAGPDDLVVIGGGGLFMDYFEPFWRGFAPLGGRLRFCMWGVGCCAMKRADSHPPRSLVGSIAARSQLCVVRDELTREFLRDHVAARVVPCPTLNVVAPHPPGRGLLHVDAFDNVGEGIYELMDRVGSEFASGTGRPFRSINNLIPAGNEAALTATLDRYVEADLILTGRLHGCIMGLAAGRQVLAVSGDHKVESFMAAAGLGDWVLGLDEVATLPIRLAALSQQTPPVAFLDRTRRDNASIAEEVMALVRGGPLVK
jgi:polysaccharide pyruvyl transferase WcaK-like protein